MNALARTFEAAGLATAVINIMPVWGERYGTPRTLGVEFPFGHTCGLPGDAAMQSRVVRAALDLLANAEGPPPVVRHFDEAVARRLRHLEEGMAPEGAVADHPRHERAGGASRAAAARRRNGVGAVAESPKPTARNAGATP